MIAHLAGVVEEKLPTGSVIVDVSGVGYEVVVAEYDYEQMNLGDKVKIYTYHAIRENAESLYGFSSLSAKRLFELLISVNGIGPKAGISILSLGSPEEVRKAIASMDVAFISKASGVGKKSAERVIVDLKDKVGMVAAEGMVGRSVKKDEALEALMALGFSLKEATEALANLSEDLSVEERIKLALKQR